MQGWSLPLDAHIINHVYESLYVYYHRSNKTKTIYFYSSTLTIDVLCTAVPSARNFFSRICIWSFHGHLLDQSISSIHVWKGRNLITKIPCKPTTLFFHLITSAGVYFNANVSSRIILRSNKNTSFSEPLPLVT